MTNLTEQYARLTALYNHKSNWEVWAREISRIANYIAVPEEEIKKAEKAYMVLGQHLSETLGLPSLEFFIYTQGSARSRTLIKPPTRADFDLDAVCEISLANYRGNHDPMALFDQVGMALEGIKGTKLSPKSRCWRLEYPGERFYIDLTPARPQNEQEWRRVVASSEFLETKIEVVNTPTRTWSPSNPRGFARWLAAIADRKIRFRVIEERVMVAKATAMDGIEAVPDQEVPLSDTLRMAIRLFKRHRDMCVRNGRINADFQPISVIIATKVANLYQQAADRGQIFDNPIQLLLHLASELIHIERRPALYGEFWVANPSQDFENFADKWNKIPNGLKCAETYHQWTHFLAEDLAAILECTTVAEAQELINKAFGTTNAPNDPQGGNKSTILQSLAPAAPSRTHTPPKTGLA